MVVRNPALGVLRELRFRNPDDFRAGSLHSYPIVWENLLSCVNNKSVDLMVVVNDGVKVEQFFTHFKGDFQGTSFDSGRPPPIVLENSRSCANFSEFISNTVLEWVSAGVLSVWGEVGQVSPPHLVLPLTVEPSKHRLCHDERYLNLWIKELPFKLDHLSDLPRYVLPGHFQTSFDEKSGYHHVSLHLSSRTFFGLKWQGFYFTFCTLPFGWKASAFLYHNLGLAVSGAARIRPVSLFPSTSMAAMLVSCWCSHPNSPGYRAFKMLRRRHTFFVIC